MFACPPCHWRKSMAIPGRFASPSWLSSREALDATPAAARIVAVPNLDPSKTAPPEQIVVGDLLLRRWRSVDLERLQRAVVESLRDLRRWLIWASDEPSAQSGFLRATSLGWDRGERFEYAIEDRRGRLIGSVGLMRRIGPGGLEIGYWVHSDHTGRGVAKLVSAAVTEAAFALPWVDHVEIHHDKANLGSGGVPAGLGFEMVEEIGKRELATDDSGVDLLWRLRRDAFPASQAKALLDAQRLP
jgi:ribosomal-protein-serine acetyltransferase